MESSGGAEYYASLEHGAGFSQGNASRWHSTPNHPHHRGSLRQALYYGSQFHTGRSLFCCPPPFASLAIYQSRFNFIFPSLGSGYGLCRVQ